MKNTAEWLAARLNRGMPATPQQQQQQQQQAPVATWPQGPQQGMAQLPQQYMPGNVPTSPALTPVLPVDESGMVHAWDAVNSWRGGTGNRTETDRCPECGGDQYFKREALRKGGVAPAPYCHTCGYNGMFIQSGTDPLDPKAPVIN